VKIVVAVITNLMKIDKINLTERVSWSQGIHQWTQQGWLSDKPLPTVISCSTFLHVSWMM